MDGEEATQASSQHLIPTSAVVTADNQDVACILVCTTPKPGGHFTLRMEGGRKREWRFGRSENLDFHLADSKRISNCHFVIWTSDNEPDTLLIRDTSTNGTFLNGSRLVKNKSYMLVNADEIAVGIGVAADEIRFIVKNPRSARTMNSDGIHAKYDFGDVLGSGAFAVVKKAVEKSTGKSFAVKIIAKNKVSSSLAVQREVQILQKLSNNYIVGLRDFAEDGNFYYLVMDYVGGGDLMEFVIDNGAIPEAASREIIRQVLVAVEYVHGLGISHRDLKPDNILIVRDEPVWIKVSDFGLAKIAQSGSFLKTFCGTLAYLAPEVLGGRSKKLPSAYSNLVDLWSIGCLAYVILTGYLPFEGQTQDQLYKNVLAGRYFRQPLEAVCLSENGWKFLDALLQVDPEKRPSAKEALIHPWILEAGYSQTRSDYSEANHLGMSSLNLESSMDRAPDLQNGDDDSDSDAMDIQEQYSQSRTHKGAINGNGPANGTHGKDNIKVSLTTPGSPLQMFSLSMGVRDLDSFPEINMEYPTGTWLRMCTLPESIPFKDICITTEKFQIGRNHSIFPNDLIIDDSRISKNHCLIQRKRNASGKQEVWLIDQSTNGCYVNDVKIGKNKKILLNGGDRLLLYLDFGVKSRYCICFKLTISNKTLPCLDLMFISSSRIKW